MAATSDTHIEVLETGRYEITLKEGRCIADVKRSRTYDALTKALEGYPKALQDTYGGYYTLGRYFVGLIGHPEVMRLATKYGLPRKRLMRFTLKLLANLTDPRGGDASDRVINALSRIAPSA